MVSSPIGDHPPAPSIVVLMMSGVSASAWGISRMACWKWSLLTCGPAPWEEVELPERQERVGYVPLPMSDQTFIPEVY